MNKEELAERFVYEFAHEIPGSLDHNEAVKCFLAGWTARGGEDQMAIHDLEPKICIESEVIEAIRKLDE
jgi:hypothetical protein